MNLAELRAIINNISKTHDKLPVQLFIVDQGLTYAQDIMEISVAEPYDGKRIWIIPIDKLIQPEWLE